jgi:hypothetical protein
MRAVLRIPFRPLSGINAGDVLRDVRTAANKLVRAELDARKVPHRVTRAKVWCLVASGASAIDIPPGAGVLHLVTRKKAF